MVGRAVPLLALGLPVQLALLACGGNGEAESARRGHLPDPPPWLNELGVSLNNSQNPHAPARSPHNFLMSSVKFFTLMYSLHLGNQWA